MPPEFFLGYSFCIFLPGDWCRNKENLLCLWFLICIDKASKFETVFWGCSLSTPPFNESRLTVNEMLTALGPLLVNDIALQCFVTPKVVQSPRKVRLTVSMEEPFTVKEGTFAGHFASFLVHKNFEIVDCCSYVLFTNVVQDLFHYILVCQLSFQEGPTRKEFASF